MEEVEGHSEMWDCVESECLKQRTHRATGWEVVTHVTVLECDECGRVVAQETEYDEMVGDMVNYGDSTVDEVLEEYDL